MSHFAKPVIPDEPAYGGRDTWFDRPFDRLTVLSKVEGLTTLSEVEGETSESDELRHRILRGEGTCSYPAEQNK